MITKTYSFEMNGKTNDVYTLSNAKGARVDVLTYGARLINIFMPDRKGNLADVAVGCKTPEGHYAPKQYFGATVGRFCNRIEKGKFTLNGVEYQLEINNGENHLHGGVSACFDREVWDAEIENNRLKLSLFSPDGAGGYPGNMQVTLYVSLTEDNEIILEYLATTDKDTVCNLTNHTFFNIGGQDTVLDHELYINARHITLVDKGLIPHGELMEIENTPYSFLKPKALGKDMFSDAEFIQACNGYDFNYCIDRVGKALEHCARVYDPESGRVMDCFTTLPGVQLYTTCSTRNFPDGLKKKYVNHCAVCLETQGYPNSPNCPEYPSTVLKAGETYHEVTTYKFSVK